MSLTTEDIKYLDGKFEAVNNKIDDHSRLLAKGEERMDNTMKQLMCHIAKPCNNISVHLEKDHKNLFAKIVGAFIVIVGVVIAIYELILRE